jgi:hypothetical protein
VSRTVRGGGAAVACRGAALGGGVSHILIPRLALNSRDAISPRDAARSSMPAYSALYSRGTPRIAVTCSSRIARTSCGPVSDCGKTSGRPSVSGRSIPMTKGVHMMERQREQYAIVAPHDAGP